MMNWLKLPWTIIICAATVDCDTGNTAATLIKSGAGAIRNLKILAGTAVITVWDNTAASGTALLPAITNPAAGMELLRDVRFTTGLTITVASSIRISIGAEKKGQGISLAFFTA